MTYRKKKRERKSAEGETPETIQLVEKEAEPAPAPTKAFPSRHKQDCRTNGGIRRRKQEWTEPIPWDGQGRGCLAKGHWCLVTFKSSIVESQLPTLPASARTAEEQPETAWHVMPTTSSSSARPGYPLILPLGSRTLPLQNHPAQVCRPPWPVLSKVYRHHQQLLLTSAASHLIWN